MTGPNERTDPTTPGPTTVGPATPGPTTPRKVVVIGGGAAGIFTAYELARQWPGDFEVKVLEARQRVGGHTLGRTLAHEGESMHVDCGAQFFFERSEPDYCELLEREGFFGSNGDVTVHVAGMTVYDATNEETTFRVPSSTEALAREFFRHPVRFMRLKKFMRRAEHFYDQGDWSVRFGDWFEGLDLGFETREMARFKRFVLRPLMYQFGLVRPAMLDELSALFVIYFFVNSLPHARFPSRIENRETGSNQLFQVYCLKNGMDGVLRDLVDRWGLDVRPAVKVRTIRPEGIGWSVLDDTGRSWPADEVVFATNPMRTLEILADVEAARPVRELLEQMPYVRVPVDIQAGQSSYMPRDPSDWELSNVRFLRGSNDEATHYMMTAWFGPVREAAVGRRFFKSWGSPALDPRDAPIAERQVHELMVGTPAFMAAREKLRQQFQGRGHLWFAGGYILDYDSQNACLRSARHVAKDLGVAFRHQLQTGLDELPELTRYRDMHEARPVAGTTSFLSWL